MEFPASIGPTLDWVILPMKNSVGRVGPPAIQSRRTGTLYLGERGRPAITRACFYQACNLHAGFVDRKLSIEGTLIVTNIVGAIPVSSESTSSASETWATPTSRQDRLCPSGNRFHDPLDADQKYCDVCKYFVDGRGTRVGASRCAARHVDHFWVSSDMWPTTSSTKEAQC